MGKGELSIGSFPPPSPIDTIPLLGLARIHDFNVRELLVLRDHFLMMQQRRTGFYSGTGAPHDGEQFLGAFVPIRGYEESLPPVPRSDDAEGIHFLGRA